MDVPAGTGKVAMNPAPTMTMGIVSLAFLAAWINAAAGALLLAHEAPKSSAAFVASVTTSARDIARAYLERRSQGEGGAGGVVRNRWGQLERYYGPRGE